MIAVKASEANPEVRTCPSFSIDTDVHASLVYPSSSDSARICQVFCGGTGNVPSSSSFINSLATNSRPTIFLSYVFGVYADKQRNALCVSHAKQYNSNEQDMLVDYHKDVLFGGSNCGLVNIAPCNSLMGRLMALINYLERTRPSSEQWSRFLYDNEEEDDDNSNGDDSSLLLSFGTSFKKLKLHLFAFSGYSQGSGHVCYLAKNYRLASATFISGPQELVSTAKDGNVDSWLRGTYRTQLLLAFKHLHEEGTDDLIYENWQLIDPLRINNDTCERITTLLRTTYLASDAGGVSEALELFNRAIFTNNLSAKVGGAENGMHNGIFLPGVASSATHPYIVTFTDDDIAAADSNVDKDASIFGCDGQLLEQMRCFVGMEMPQQIFLNQVPPPPRPNHCSTVLDSATPLNDENKAKYAYSIWPLLSQLATEAGGKHSQEPQVSKI